MPESGGIPSITQIPGQVLDWLVDLLGKVGIELPPALTQGVLLVVGLFLFGWLLRAHLEARKKPETPDPGSFTRLLGLVALGLLVACVLFNWGEQALRPFPDHLFGRVVTDCGDDVHAELLDFKGDVIPAGSGELDSATGEFALVYRPSFGNPPRSIRVAALGHAPLVRNVSRAELRSREPVVIHYSCGGPR